MTVSTKSVSHILEAQSPEWLKFRAKFITGTEVACLFGLNKYKSMLDVAREKTGFKGKQLDNSSFVRIGRMFEDTILAVLGYDAAAPYGKVHMLIPEDPQTRISCSLDGLVLSEYAEIGIPIECKCMVASKWLKTLKRKVPPQYALQLITQMFLCGSSVGAIAVLPYTADNFNPAKFDVEFKIFPLTLHEIYVSPFVITKENLEIYKEVYEMILNETARFWEDPFKFKVNKEYKARMIECLDIIVPEGMIYESNT